MTKEKYPARVHILLATERKSGVVIRRGPSKKTCVLLWNRKTNEFKIGQWLYGRIYERRSDLSPDGTHLIYFAMNGRWDSEVKGSWTAISKAPWIKAVTLLAKGDCWHGGGMFLSNKEYWLNNGFGHQLLFDSKEVKRNLSYTPPEYYGGECPNVYYNRLQRDGWNLCRYDNKDKLHPITIFEKKILKNWKLRKIAHAQASSRKGKSVYWDEHELINAFKDVIKQPDWEWADWVDDKLVWSEKGCLFGAHVKSSRKIGKPKFIHDFNKYQYERIKAPY